MEAMTRDKWTAVVSALLAGNSVFDVIAYEELPLETLYGTVKSDVITIRNPDSSTPQELVRKGAERAFKGVLAAVFDRTTTPDELKKIGDEIEREKELMRAQNPDTPYVPQWFANAFNAVRNNVRFGTDVHDLTPEMANNILKELLKPPLHKNLTKLDNQRREAIRSTWLEYTVTAKGQQEAAMLQRLGTTTLPVAASSKEAVDALLADARAHAQDHGEARAKALTAIAESVHVVDGPDSRIVMENEKCAEQFEGDLEHGNVVRYMTRLDDPSRGTCINFTRKQASRCYSAIQRTYGASSVKDVNTILNDDDRRTFPLPVQPTLLRKPFQQKAETAAVFGARLRKWQNDERKLHYDYKDWKATALPEISDEEIFFPSGLGFQNAQTFVATWHAFRTISYHSTEENVMFVHPDDAKKYFLFENYENAMCSTYMRTSEGSFWRNILLTTKMDVEKGSVQLPRNLSGILDVDIHSPIIEFKRRIQYVDTGALFMSAHNVKLYKDKAVSIVSRQQGEDGTAMLKLAMTVKPRPQITSGTIYVPPSVLNAYNASPVFLPLLVRTNTPINDIIYVLPIKYDDAQKVYLCAADMERLSPQDPSAVIDVTLYSSETAILSAVKPSIRHSMPQGCIGVSSDTYEYVHENTAEDEVAVICLSTGNTAVYGVPVSHGDEGVSINAFSFGRLTTFEDTPQCVLDIVQLPVTDSITISTTLSAAEIGLVPIVDVFRTAFEKSEQSIIGVGDEFSAFIQLPTGVVGGGGSDVALTVPRLKHVTMTVRGMQPLCATRIPRAGNEEKKVDFYVI